MRKVSLSLAAILAAVPAIATAQDEDVTNLAAIIVSGGFTPVEAQLYGRSVSVLTSEEIEDRGITTVQDALRSVPGLMVNGSGDSFTQVRIRGAEANHTLILIDGVEASGGDSEYILSGLDTANIERIEVLRGPQSVFYGSNASAGVINIITKSGGIGTEYGSSAEAGPDGYRASARASSRTERGGIAFSFAHDNDDGYDTSGDGGEEDGIRRNTLQLRGDYLVTDWLKLGFNFRSSDERYDSDSTSFTATDAVSYVVDDPTQFSDREEQLAQVYAELDTLGGRLKHRLSIERTDFDRSFNGGTPTETTTEAAKYLLSFGLSGQRADEADHLLNAMLEWEEDSSSSNPAFARETKSFALEYRGSFANGLDLQLGVRHDNNSVFEDATSWTASVSYTFAGSGVRLHSSAGTGVVNPSYFELFSNSSFGSTTYLGNPNLQPEENRSFDFGVEVPFLQGRGLVDLTYFDETLTGEIESYMVNATTFSYRNQAGDSDRKGVELAASLEASEYLDLRLSYTYLDATNPNGSVEIRRPEHELLLSATLDIFNGSGSVTADIRHVAGNWDSQFFGTYATAELPDYTTVDVAAQYELTNNVVLTGRVTNLFDEDYADVWGYAKRGRAAYIGLRASF
ncbi:TonB-dependent receptor plug domain-containing protein [Phaeobacter gallaeciensis]|uniref:TonB-dependent receptor plug domain-containing protein n=1 Tax=Phaeobacter gallaeciensis TaxID=60890 RepID=UPI000BC0E5AD|nr:TonB-dependent receptor [Phaeobacter gallaeciensis]ATF18223.1 Outer membrane cobalamin receptor protein [Phaeobacter gallaeciensis]ATF22332.1 Outer membrane cobalamin receptor protein [Phaeobacter gallaeciensis]